MRFGIEPVMLYGSVLVMVLAELVGLAQACTQRQMSRSRVCGLALIYTGRQSGRYLVLMLINLHLARLAVVLLNLVQLGSLVARLLSANFIPVVLMHCRALVST